VKRTEVKCGPGVAMGHQAGEATGLS
jgi:hypothetical protein